MAIQDDKRENEIIALLRLQKGTTRSGVDAFYRFEENGQEYSAEIELKSTTNETVSTARDVGMDHIQKWRRRIWIIGYYNASGDTLLSLLALSSQDMDSWISSIENYIRPDFTIGQRAASKLNLEDLYTVCGKKRNYTIEDAQALHKMQWKKEQYEREKDLKEGYSPRKMLEILRLRALYLNQRGSTLNNLLRIRGLQSSIRRNILDLYSDKSLHQRNKVRQG